MKSAAADHLPKTKLSYAFSSCLTSLLKSVGVLLQAYALLRRHVAAPIPLDYSGGCNMLDGPHDADSAKLLQSSRNRKFTPSKAVEGHADASNTDEFVNQDKLKDLHAVTDCFLEASSVYDPLSMPRFCIQWLENLARFHELQGNRAESAETRWRIFQICRRASEQIDTNESKPKWFPQRVPIVWNRAGKPVELNVEINVDGGSSEKVAVNLRSFVLTLDGAVSKASQNVTTWKNPSQLVQHMETCLRVSAERFAAINFFGLAERSLQKLIELYRREGNLQKMIATYDKIGTLYRTLTETSSTFSMGSFYRVEYLGKGIFYLLN